MVDVYVALPDGKRSQTKVRVNSYSTISVVIKDILNHFPEIPDGNYDIVLSKSSKDTQIRNFSISDGDTLIIQESLPSVANIGDFK